MHLLDVRCQEWYWGHLYAYHLRAMTLEMHVFDAAVVSNQKFGFASETVAHNKKDGPRKLMMTPRRLQVTIQVWGVSFNGKTPYE